MAKVKPPAANPCGSCPYRRDVPSGVWELDEYMKLLPYDLETHEQPHSVFMCHRQDGRLCAGWVAVHDMYHCLAFRLATATGKLDGDDVQVVLDYETETPLFDSGKEAAIHGVREIAKPGSAARRIMEKLQPARPDSNRQPPPSESGALSD